MGKKRSKDGVHKKSLADQIEDPWAQGVRVKPRKKARKQASAEDEDGEVDANQSKKILSLAKEQQQERAREEAQAADAADIGAARAQRFAAQQIQSRSYYSTLEFLYFRSSMRYRVQTHWQRACDSHLFIARVLAGALEAAVKSLSRKQDLDSEDESELEGSEDVEDIIIDDDAAFAAEDEDAFNAFMQRGSGQQGQLLSDQINAKLRERVQPASESRDGGAATADAQMDEDMEHIYEDVGKLLSR
jgi:hypothetical protein